MIDSPSSSGMLRSSTTRSGTSVSTARAQALAAVAERHVEAVHLEVVADHVAGRRLVVDDEDVLLLGHAASFIDARQCDGEGRALPGPRTFHGDMAAVKCR